MSDNTALRPFEVNIPEAELVELRKRINATRWPEKEPVADHSQGVPLATMQKLARYWATEYDWRKVEARLQALPHFITERGSTASRARAATAATRRRPARHHRTTAARPRNSRA